MLTTAGKTFLAIGVLALGSGIALDYAALVSLGIGLLVAVLVGRLWILRRPSVDVRRAISPERVRSGRPATSELTITNAGRRRTAGGLALEQFGNTKLPIELPALEPDQTASILTELPTEKRGVFRVGPLDVTRSDPFGLVRSGESETGVAQLWVHPIVHEILPFPSGYARDLEGPDSGEALEGGVTFHTLRDYVRGDDLRLIHWRSSAKSGKLMVRHNVDTNQPRSLVLLDTRASSYQGDYFEDAVRAAASVVISSVKRGFDFRFLTTDGTELVDSMPTPTILDAFAELGLSVSGGFEAITRELTSDLGGVSLTVITGSIVESEMALLSQFRSRFDVVTVARFAANTERIRGIPDAIIISAQSSEEFARAWNQATRR